MMEFFKGTITAKDWTAVGIILGIALILAVLFVTVVHKNQQKTIESIVAEDEVVKADLAKAREKERDIVALREEAGKTQELVTNFERRLPLGREIPLLVKQFEGLAAEVSLNIVLTPLPPAKDARKETIPYSVIAKGNFHQIASFINRLERFERYLKVSDLKISKEEEGVCEAKFTLSTYRFIQSTPVTATDQSAAGAKS